jgi:two-component system chemotaxis response regulator CheB
MTADPVLSTGAPPGARLDATRAGLRAVVIGASAGGVEALRVLFAALPAELDVPVLVVLHVSGEVRWAWSTLFAASRLAVREAEDKLMAEAGTIYMAPADYHLLVDRSGELALSLDEPVHFARPSIDVLFDSAAWGLGAGVLGILLTGANQDGAAGLRAIQRGGGACWVQAPATAVIDVMPRAGLAAVPSARVLSLQQMAEALGARCAQGAP